MGLCAIIDYQQAQIDSVDASLAQLDNTQSLAGRLVNGDQAISAVLARNSAITTCGQYAVPLGQALRLMKNLIHNVAQGHPFLRVGWALLSSLYTVSLVQTLGMN
ncbi:hypothetical protein BDN67DRAFT_968485, partial [Paxillus ammoniavirescens]